MNGPHAYDVTPIIRGDTLASIRKFRANCPCGAWFAERETREAAGLDGLDHVRTTQGRRTRSEELTEIAEAKKAATAAKRYGVKRT